jgi:hypothetical protein
MFTHKIQYWVETLSQGHTLKSFQVKTSFGKTALCNFRAYVRELYPEAKIVTPDKTVAGFHYVLNDGDTIELH